ncbi:MAG: VOC family protein [Acidimicrobiia bacterium]
MAKVKPIPDGYPRITPYLYIDGAAAAIDFYCSILGGTERMRLPAPDDKVGHAEIQFGDSVVMLADESPEMGALSPKTVGGTPMSLMLFVEDADATAAKAVDAGATITEPVSDKFYGDRSGTITDPWGHSWNLATHIEDVSPEDMEARMNEMMG